MKHLPIIIPTPKTLIKKTAWSKKGLATYKIDLVGLCEFGCTYCSSNTNTWHRIVGPQVHAPLIEEKYGEGVDRFNTPSLTYHYDDVIGQLTRELSAKSKSWGRGKTLSFGNLTDNFSPSLVKDGITEEALRLIIKHTSFRIRILTKNSIVGSARWIEILKEFGDRVVVGLSIGTTNDEWASKVELGTSKPSARIRAHQALQDAGVPTFGMLCPVFPHAEEELDDLIDAIRPEQCEHVWAEPYNDRDNWRRIVADTETAEALERLFTSRAAWSEYAADLYQRLLQASKSGWTSKLIYMLYEAKIPEECAALFGDLTGIYLQSLGDNGLSTNPAFAALQRPDAEELDALSEVELEDDKSSVRSAAARKAWETRRRNAVRKANCAPGVVLGAGA